MIFSYDNQYCIIIAQMVYITGRIEICVNWCLCVDLLMKYLWFIFISTCFLYGRTIEEYPNQAGAPGFLKLSESSKLHSSGDGLYQAKPKLDSATKITQDKGTNVGSSIVRIGIPGMEDIDAVLRFKAGQPSFRKNANGGSGDITNLTLPNDIKQPDIAAHYYSLGLQGGVIIGGAIFWKYTERWTGNFEIDNECFFRRDSDNGGSDKLGHAYAWNLLTRGLISIYDRHGFSRNESIFWGITIPTMNGVLVELLDGYTTNGASLEDILFNLIGSGSAALLYLNPALDETFHLDWSYWPSRELPLEPVENDITTDYSGQMFTLEINFRALF